MPSVPRLTKCAIALDYSQKYVDVSSKLRSVNPESRLASIFVTLILSDYLCPFLSDITDSRSVESQAQFLRTLSIRLNNKYY